MENSIKTASSLDTIDFIGVTVKKWQQQKILTIEQKQNTPVRKIKKRHFKPNVNC